MYILYNDTIMPRHLFRVDLEDRGYQFGDGIYEVIRFYDRVPFELEAHLRRLAASAEAIRIPLPVSLERLGENIGKLIGESSIQSGIIYIQLTRGVAPRGHLFPAAAQPVLTGYLTPVERPVAHLEQGIAAITTEDIRWLRVDIKTINLLPNILAKQQAHEAGAHEAIFVRNGTVTEGSSSNLFGIRDGVCYTHPANHLILNGITRQVVLRLLNSVGLKLREEAIPHTELYRMDEVFITSTVQEVCPVIRIDGQPVGEGKPGAFTRALQSAFEQAIGTSQSAATP
ncbi:MAG: D-amino-acid transaminase [Bacillus thermozeamaize]|jgi:D-alanine transaminase|uniref:D-alanine aminotransferase n=1 Tax=Bacillus thermozeamaize TaxID=230954 RepID=A0A1Y3PLL9_9BACI|nr:MAG: D-amino-acid transaminase [Bacillus thermozeamaize]